MVAEAYSRYITPQEYLALERAAETKSEYLDGELFAMAGASRNHNTLTMNAGTLLNNQLRGTPYRPWANDMRVSVGPGGMYTYPDVLVVCPPLLFDDEHEDTLLNPKIIIEVLSPSTEDKFARYQRLSSLTDYILVSQHKMRVEHFHRQANGDWLLHVAEAPEDAIELPEIGCRIVLHDLYEGVEWPSDATSPQVESDSNRPEQ
jgi:Uma2 family endonuclease